MAPYTGAGREKAFPLGEGEEILRRCAPRDDKGTYDTVVGEGLAPPGKYVEGTILRAEMMG